MAAAPLGPPAHAAPGDPGELWVNVSSDATFDVLEGATVTLYDDTGTELGTAVTDEFGDVGFTSLASGSYFVSAAAAGHVPEFYFDSPDLAGAAEVFVDEFGSDNPFMSLAGEPQIQGTVTGPGGTPLEVADVSLYQYDTGFDFWSWVDSASTGQDGRYSFEGLGDGTYRLGFAADGHIEEFYANRASVEAGDDVVVTTGAAPVTADAELELAKHISGTVTDGSGPLELVQVSAQQQVEEFGDVFWQDVAFTETAGDGSYTLDVDPGEYRVFFESDAHLPEWWNDAHVEGDADPVTVTSTDVTGIDATLDEGGSIAGTVTAASGGAPVPNIEATAYRWNADDEFWDFVSSDTTDAAGTYAIDNLLDGTYRVGFETFGTDFLTEYYDGADEVEDATDVPVTTGNTTGGIDAALDKGAIIQGTVSGPGGPLTSGDYDVALYEPAGFSESGWSETFDFPDISGSTYRFSGLQPGTYRVRVSAPGLAPEFWQDVYEVGEATDIVAAKNTTKSADVTLGTALAISGTVTDVAGPLVGADVEVQRKNTGPDGRYWDTFDFTETTTGGNYSVPVPPGTYRLRFTAFDHVAEWHDGSETSSRSTQLALTGANADVDATLDRLGRVAGTVTGPSGAVSGATVGIWRFERRFGTDQTFWRVRSATTNASGTYSVTGLQPGNYRVGFRASGLAAEFNLDAVDVEHADDVAVELNETDTVHAALVPPVQQLSGTVSGEQAGGGSAPLADADVTVERRVTRQDYVVLWQEFATTTTDAAGNWSVPVHDGDHRVSFSAPGHLDQWYDGASTEADADVVAATGTGQSGIDAVLPRAGTIAGTVTDAGTSQPIADAEVFAWTPDGDHDAFAFTDDNGAFTLDDLVPGEWVVSYSADGHVEEYWDDQPSVDTADRIAVTAGSAHTADAALAAATPVSGTVTGTGGAPLDFARVDLYRELPGDLVEYYDTVFTESDGTWSAPVPPGTYYFEFADFSDDGYLDEWYDGATTQATATPVVVGGAPVTGVDAQLAVGGVLEGTVTGPGGGPVSDAYVSVYPAGATSDFDTVWEEFVDEDGHYRATGLPAGSYRVRFETFDGELLAEFHSNKADLASADPVSVALGAATTVDAELAAVPWTISGTVTDAQDRGLDDADVTVYRKAGPDTWEFYRSTLADADGAYDVPVVAGEYRVEFFDFDNRLQEWWNDAETLGQATSVLVTGADRAGIDAQLVDGGIVTGTVTYPSHQTGWDSRVTLFDASSGEWMADAYVSAHQNRFRVDELPAGTYRAEFNRLPGFHTAEAQFWSARAEHQGAGTQTFTVTAGSTTPNVDATLVDGGILTGRVENGLGAPLEGCTVSAYTPTGSLVSRVSHPTAADGAVLVPGLTTGSYRIRVSGGECGLVPLYYDGVGPLAASEGAAVGVPATRGSTVAIPQDLVVPTGGVVENTTLPTISDTTPEVGQTLTASAGAWSPADVTVSYQWLADGAPIAGATGATYVVKAADAGKALSVRVTASKPDHVDGVATSAPTAPVVSTDPPINNTAVPTISDTTPEVGQALTATNGSWSETGLDFAYQWTADGADIPGATNQSFQVTAAQLGAVLRVRVTASKSGFADGSATSAATSEVDEPDVVTITKPTISDTTPEIGQTLTATNGTWSQTGLTFSYQWTANGADVAGATSSTYQVVAGDEGKQLRVRVTASKAGFDAGTATSDPTAAVVKPSLNNTAVPTISDTTPEVGQDLTATSGTWSETGATFAFQWWRGTTPIAGATGPAYTTVAADVGHPLRVRVTASKSGFSSGTAESAPTEAVVDPNAEVTNLTAPLVTGTAQVGRTLTAAGGTWDPADASLAYQWLRDGGVIAGATGTTYDLVAADLGRAISVRVTASKAGMVSGVATSAPTAAVEKGTITAGTPKVAGKTKVGKTLTAKPGASTPDTVKVTYQWLRNGKAIKRAKKVKYKLTKKDRGKKISVRVTRTAAGYDKLVLVSKKTRVIK